MLEHLDRDDAVEAAVELEVVHVGRDDRDVRRRARLDALALQARVGDGRDARAGIALGRAERERAPAAAEVEDLHAVLEPRALAGEREHRLLGLGERRRPSSQRHELYFSRGPSTSSKNSGGTS